MTKSKHQQLAKFSYIKDHGYQEQQAISNNKKLETVAIRMRRMMHILSNLRASDVISVAANLLRSLWLLDLGLPRAMLVANHVLSTKLHVTQASLCHQLMPKKYKEMA